MFCHNCGTSTHPTASFCGTCGGVIRRSATPPGWTATAVTPDGFPVAMSAGSGYSTAAIILGVLAILFVPIVLGPAGIVLGAIAKSKGEARATAGIIVAICGTVLGMIIGALAAVGLA